MEYSFTSLYDGTCCQFQGGRSVLSSSLGVGMNISGGGLVDGSVVAGFVGEFEGSLAVMSSAGGTACW